VWHDAGHCLVGWCGQANYTTTPKRWGDYTATAIDNQASTTQYIWFSGMYSNAAGSRTTRTGRVGYTNVNQP
jgi:hypothetical protein